MFRVVVVKSCKVNNDKMMKVNSEIKQNGREFILIVNLLFMDFTSVNY